MASNVHARLVAILRFLKRNKRWNRDLQMSFYRQALSNAGDPLTRLKSLLFSSVNAQSQPDLDLLCEFWRKVEAYNWRREALTVKSLTTALATFLDPSDNAKTQKAPAGSWARLFQVLRFQKGWGNKTAALFVKASINIHRSSDTSLRFLEFAGTVLRPRDTLYLPVDVVIERVFKELFGESANFKSINKRLESFPQVDMLIWDDLWFWGFITQRSNGSARTIEWNPAKFWGLEFSPKVHEKRIEKLARQFIKLLQPTGAHVRALAKH